MKVKKIKNKTLNKFELSLLIIAFAQIILLMNTTPAYSYMVHQVDLVIEKETANLKIERHQENKLNNLLLLLKWFFSIKQIGFVSADTGDSGWNCCTLGINGEICQDTLPLSPCQTDLLPTKCDSVDNCRSGCCMDNEEGLCSTNSPKQKCIVENGTWNSDANCLNQECIKGCCVLGSNAQFVTETRCGVLSLVYGFEKDFRGSVNTEIKCLALAASQKEGACIVGGSCSLKTEAECLSIGGTFSEGNLCSHPNLGTNCEKQKTISCVEGKDEIYWFDSCGNRENIYSSDKNASWNNGEILEKENACSPSSSNVDSAICGNCNHFLGSKCSSRTNDPKVEDGDYVCENLNCVDSAGKTWKNGESWCVYDGYIGEGKDTVGSRHWKRMCIDGEIKSEGCADYRGAICVQSEIGNGTNKITSAGCVMNEALACLTFNSEKNPESMKSKCRANTDCMIKNVDIAENFHFDMCVGRYTKGFDLTGEERAETSGALCKYASQECKVVYRKTFGGSWECINNCDCESGKFSEQMNDLCISLGDCGSYVNYIGKGTDNIIVDGASTENVKWQKYAKYATPILGQHAEPKDIRAIMGLVFGTNINEFSEEEDAFQQTIESVGTIAGATGSLTIYATTSSVAVVNEVTGAVSTVSTSSLPLLTAFAYAAVGAVIGMYIGSWLAQKMGRSGAAATTMMIAGAVAGAAIGVAAGVAATTSVAGASTLSVLMGGAGALSWCPICLIIIVIIAILVMLYTWLSGWGKTKTISVRFECMPWQAPTGGDDCDKCNGDSLKPCTEYRCSSLGQACKLVNENTESPTCESLPQESIPPQIIPGNILTSGFYFQNQSAMKVDIRGDNDECVPEFTQVLFTLKTDEVAQCKYSFMRTDNYENMQDYALELNRFVKENHTFGFWMPSIDSLYVYNVTGDVKERFGNMNMYVRCQDYFGNYNLNEYMVNFCVKTGPDLTPSRISLFTPLSGSYIAYNQTTSPLNLYLNEPADCKYDLLDKTYDEMANTMNCSTDLFSPTMYGWDCSTELTGLSGNENKFYFRCKDQPWLPPENTSRNINQESTTYILSGSSSQLKIDSVSPQGDIEVGHQPVSIDLEVKTSGGAKNGESACSYRYSNYTNYVLFFDTYSTNHKQNFNMLIAGPHNAEIQCADDAGNLAFGNSSFNLIVDSSPPTVVRAYKDSGSLKLITDEEAECYYDFGRCTYPTENGTSMTTGLSKTHTASWIEGQTYFVKCKDVWENGPDNECSMIVSPSVLG